MPFQKHTRNYGVPAKMGWPFKAVAVVAAAAIVFGLASLFV